VLLTNRISPVTGERGDVFILSNRSSQPCRLDGYPRLVFLAGGRRLPFEEVVGPKSSYVTRQPPTPVVIDAGGQAYFMAAKYRCDSGVLAIASKLLIDLPGQRGALERTLPGPQSASTIDYCRRSPGNRERDPGNFVAVSPIVATPAAAAGTVP
jgi:hypothetical protein